MSESQLILHGGKILSDESDFPWMRHVTPHCSSCGKKVAEEIWVKDLRSPTSIMTPPDGYVRAIFGIHPDIYSAHTEPVPAIFTPVYFCKQCENDMRLVYSLVKTLATCDPPKHPSEWPSHFDPTRGCWITIWTLDTCARPRWPLDYQVNLKTFREIIEMLRGIPKNPFRIY